MNKVSFLLAIAASFLVWIFVHSVLKWPHPIAWIVELLLILASCLITLLILNAGKSILEGGPSGYLTQILLMLGIGLGAAYVLINTAKQHIPPSQVVTPLATVVIDCEQIRDKDKVAFPNPLVVRNGWDVALQIKAKKFRTNVWINAFTEVDPGTLQPIPGSTKKPFPVQEFFGMTTNILAGKYYKNIGTVPVTGDAGTYYKYTVTCQEPSEPQISADPMIEIPR